MRKNAFEKIVSVAASLALVVGLMPAAAFAEAGEGAAAAQLASGGGTATLQDAATSGTWGDLTWTYDAATKTVTISGKGGLSGGRYSNPGWKTAGLESVDFDKVVLSDGVTSIGDYAFYNCASLASVDIPSSVASIGAGAFSGCTSLDSADIPTSVASIGSDAFSDCTSLDSVEIPSSVTSMGDYAFKGCTSLASVAFADGSQLASIDEYAFYNCSSLGSVEIPSSVASIGERAFSGCISLDSVDIPSSVTSMGDYAFYGCVSLASVAFADGSQLAAIGDYAFYGCASLDSVEIPSSVTSIGSDAFDGCTSLVLISFETGSQLASVGEYAFRGCTSLVSMEIPSSVTSIGNHAFYKCTSLTSVTVPSSVASMGKYAFGSSSSEPTVYYGGNESDKATAAGGNDVGGSWVYKHVHSVGVEGGSSKAATCTEWGYTADTCVSGEACNYRNYVAAGHYMTKTPAKAATATEPGTLGYFTCSRCGKVFEDEAGTVETTVEKRAIPALGQYAAKRLAGDDAYGTMASIVNTGWAAGSCDTVILATFNGYWDALAASGLAGICGWPVLLTDKNSLSSAAESEIGRLGAKTVVIVGGTAAVSDAVEDQVKQLGCATMRCAGADAVATAVEIYRAALDIRGWGDTCIVATVNGYYDALSASPYAYAKNAPIFLANSDGTISADVVAAIKSYGFSRVVIAGGTARITDDAASALASATGASIDRRAGANCFSTSVELAKLCLEDGMTMTRACFATGFGGYWDALTGAALAGKYGSPLLLVDDGYEDAIDFVKSNKSSVSQPYIFGGERAVSPSIESKLNAAIK